MTDEGVGNLAAGCPQLSSLNLTSCSKVTDEGVGKLAAGCPQLCWLGLVRCYEVTDNRVAKLAAGCLQLSELYVRGCLKVTDNGMGMLAAGCAKLSLLDVCDYASDASDESKASNKLHAALRLLEFAQTRFAGVRVMGSVPLHLLSTVRRACRVLHAVPLQDYLHAVPLDRAKLQRVVCERVWPPMVRSFVLAAILRVPGFELAKCLHKVARNGHVDAVDVMLEANAAVDSPYPPGPCSHIRTGSPCIL